MAAASGEAPAGAEIVPRYGRYPPVTALTASNTASSTIALERACANGLDEVTIDCMMAFQSVTASACATAVDRTQVATIRTSANPAFNLIFTNRMAVSPLVELGSDRKLNRVAHPEVAPCRGQYTGPNLGIRFL